MAKRSLRGSIDELPVFAGIDGDYNIAELVLITYKTTPDALYKKQEMGGVIGRDPECEHIYFVSTLLLKQSRRLAIVGRSSLTPMQKIPLSFLEDYEIIKVKN